MPESKWQLSFAFILFGFLSGCSPDQKTKEYNQLSREVYVGEVKGQALEGNKEANWSLIHSRQFSLQTCLEDKAKRLPIENSPVLIRDGEKTIVETQVVNGCIHWVEQVNFDPTQTASYLVVKRQIAFKSGIYNAATFQFLLNPWVNINGSKDAVVDQRFDQRPNLPKTPEKVWTEKAEPKSPAKSSAQLRIPSVNINPKTAPDEGFQIVFQPMIAYQQVSGMDDLQAIQEGKLKVELQFRKIKGGETQNWSQLITITPVNISRGQVVLNDVNLGKRSSIEKNNGTLYVLWMRVSAIDGAQNLSSTEGNYRIGDFNQLQAGVSAQKINEPLAQAKNNQQLQATDASFELNSIRGSTLGPLQEDTVFRQVGVELKAKVASSLTGQTLNGEKFLITRLDDQTSQTVTVYGDHLTWNLKVAHNYYDTIQCFPIDLEIKNLRDNSSLKKRVYVNPWVRFFFVVRDADSMEPLPICEEKNNLLPQQFKRPYLVLDSASIKLSDIKYEVDPQSLDLKMKLNYNFSGNPTVRRLDDPMFGPQTSENLRPGYYRLTLAVISDADLNQDNIKPLAITQQYINYSPRRLNVNLDLPLSVPALMAVRSYMVFKLDFLDPKSIQFDKQKNIISAQALNEKTEPTFKLITPPQVMSFVPENNSLGPAIQTNNWVDPNLDTFAKKLAASKVDLDALFLNEQKSSRTISDNSNRHVDFAREWGMQLLDFDDDQYRAFDPEQNIEVSGLECLDQIMWQDKRLQARCLYQDPNIYQGICVALSDHIRRSFYNAKLWGTQAAQKIYQTFRDECMQDPGKYIAAQKLVFPIGVNKSVVDAQGYQTSFRLRTLLVVGNELGTEYMNERRVFLRGTFGVKANAIGVMRPVKTDNKPIDKDLRSHLEIAADSMVSSLLMSTSDQFLKYLGGKLAIFNPKVGATPKLQLMKQIRNFLWAFDYQIPDNTARLSSTARFNIQMLKVNLSSQRVRTCYSLEVDARELRQSLIDHQIEVSDEINNTWLQAITKRMICEPVKNETTQLTENYYVLYSDPSNDTLLDSHSDLNRVFVTLRGDRDFYMFLKNMRDGLGGTQLDDLPKYILSDVNKIRDGAWIGYSEPGLYRPPRPDDSQYELVTLQQGFFKNLIQTLSQWFNPFEQNRAPILRDQGNPNCRIINYGDVDPCAP